MNNYFFRLSGALSAGYRAFQEKMVGVDLNTPQNFTAYEARKLRYAILWAMFENSAYSKMHTWAQGYKSQYGLYKFIRHIYNPSARIGEFWTARLLGGPLDPDAGDGLTVPSALPILTDNDGLRPAIAQVWKWSNWQVRKDILSLHGTILGDGAILVVDDVARGKVYMKNLHPGALKDVTLDAWGNVKAYVISEPRLDPRPNRSGEYVTYTEIAVRDGENVNYQTFLDQSLYAWNNDQGPEWSETYGFIPLVTMQHNNVGLDFGWSELHQGLAKFREVDDAASKLSDQIRKMVDAPWLLGMAKPSNTPKTSADTSAKDEAENPQPERQQIPIFYAGAGNAASAVPLVSPLNIADASGHITSIIEDIERDYPELRSSLTNVTGDISGRALRINREPIEDRVQRRRVNYDDAIVRAQQMALTIGGMRGYDKFSGINMDSFNSGALDHSIGARPVFRKDEMDDLENEAEFWTVGAQAKSFGVPPLVWLKEKRWSDERIKEIQDSPEYQARMAAMQAAADAAKQPTPPTGQRFPPPNTNASNQSR